jgi:hypothetical protein
MDSRETQAMAQFYITIAGHGAVEFDIYLDELQARITHWLSLGHKNLTIKQQPVSP